MKDYADRHSPVRHRSVRHRSVRANAIHNRTVPRTVGRILLGAFLLLAGISHLTVSRVAFRAQVPPWLPLDADLVVVVSGIVEIALGLSLILLVRRQPIVGVVAAVFFLLVLPGNISQLVTHTDSFGLNTDLSRGIRLLFQPLLVLWALWSTGAWTAIHNRRRQA